MFEKCLFRENYPETDNMVRQCVMEVCIVRLDDCIKCEGAQFEHVRPQWLFRIRLTQYIIILLGFCIFIWVCNNFWTTHDAGFLGTNYSKWPIFLRLS